MSNVTSQAYQFDQDFSIDEIISDAYERIGLVGTSGHQLKTARRSLNILFQEWGNRGLHFWEVGNTNVTLTQGSTTNVDVASIFQNPLSTNFVFVSLVESAGVSSL